jgi:hypothetical protein
MIIDPITQQNILFYVQIASLIFLMLYVLKTWEMASATRKAAEATEKSVHEMREARDQESAPYVIAYFDIPIGHRLIYLVVKNIGHSVATQVKLTFSPPLISIDNEPFLSKMNFLRNGIESMPPNYEIRTLFDTTPAYFNNDKLPLIYNVKISYYGGIESHQRSTELFLDLSAHKGLMFVHNKDLGDLVNNLEELVKESHDIKISIDNIESSLEQGILISNSNLMVTSIEAGNKNLKKILLAKLNEFENIWAISYRDDRKREIGQEKLQRQAIILGKQIITLMANGIDDAPTKILENLATISYKLYELGGFGFYGDGGESLKKFNELGDSIVSDIINFKAENR